MRLVGLGQAELAVEENNLRARALYERLGYVAYGSALEVGRGCAGRVRQAL